MAAMAMAVRVRASTLTVTSQKLEPRVAFVSGRASRNTRTNGASAYQPW